MQKKYVLLLTLVIVIMFFSGCLNQNTTNNNDNNNNNAGSNTVTLIHSIQMFDFSTGQYVSEDFTTEDIDPITITTEGKIRLYAHNDALIREVGVTEFLSYIDVSVGSTCELIDNEGGTATFTVDEIGTSTEGYPSATITWSYSS